MKCSNHPLWLLLIAMILLIRFRLALVFLPLSVLSRQPLGQSLGRVSEPEKTARSVARAARLLPGTGCLPRALTARAMLARQGYVVTLRVGATKTENGLKAHAWLEDQGRVLPEGSDKGFQPVPLMYVDFKKGD